MGTPKYKASIVIAALALGAVIALASLFGCGPHNPLRWWMH